MGERQCVGCGRYVPEHLTECPFCREPLPEIPHLRGTLQREGGPLIRRGLLWMLLAAVFYYFAGGHSPLPFPVPFARVLTDYLLPLLFLSGLGLATYGFYRSITQ